MADRLTELEAAKDLIWSSMLEVNPDYPEKRAALMAQWRALEADVAKLQAEVGKAGDPVDEIAARRTARGGATSRLGRAAGGPR